LSARRARPARLAASDRNVAAKRAFVPRQKQEDARMNRYFFALGLGPAFALGACGGTTNETVTTVDNVVSSDSMTSSNMADANMADGNMAAEAMPATGQAFADTAAASDAYEIAAGKLAQQKATAQALKDFGGMMVTAHTDSTAKLKAAAAKASPAITPDPALTAEQQANLGTLRQATGADFDSAYKAQQVAAHQKTLAAMQGYADAGDVPSLKAFAADTSKVVQMHLDKAKAL
jgi:putative membrane protein